MTPKGWLTHLATRVMLDPVRVERNRAKASAARAARGEPPTLHWFHQVDDPYSQLLVQRLDALVSSYGLQLQAHLVPGPDAVGAGDPQRLPAWARRDAADVAPGYGVSFTDPGEAPEPAAVLAAQQRLLPLLGAADAVVMARAVGDALWSGQPLPGDASADASAAEVSAALAAGADQRSRWGHWLGGMLWFDGEWYWGLDRVLHLEQRLRGLGLGPAADAPLLVPRPEAAVPEAGWGDGCDGRVTLSYFPSLRSPYTAIAHRRVADLVARTGARLEVRPVLPMVMRGVPLQRAKARYIPFDTLREGQLVDEPFGPIIDPIGQPVLRAFSLWPWLQDTGRAMDWMQVYLDAAWHSGRQRGMDITTDRGLARVTAAAGLDWVDAREHLDDPAGARMLASNLDAMIDLGLWGVPSFQVSGGGAQPWSTWGQDRLWRVETEMAHRVG